MASVKDTLMEHFTNTFQNEENHEYQLQTLQQQIQELQEYVLLLKEENTNLRLKQESKERSLPDQGALVKHQHTYMQQTAPKSRKKYKKTSGAANMVGELYEVMMASLVYSRCQARGKSFLLASNMEVAAPLDDVVLVLENNVVFIQLKHSVKDKKIYDSMFLQLVSDFSLMKYFKAYLNIKNKWNTSADLRSCGDFNKAVFVLYTNAHMAKEKNQEADTESFTSQSEWQSILFTEGECVQVSRKTHPHYYQLFESLPKDREILINSKDGENEKELLDIVRRLQNFNAKTAPDAVARQKLLKEMVSMDELPEYENFLSHLWIFTSQKNCQKLHSCIKEELCNLWKTCHKKTDSIAINFITQMQTWWRDESYFLDGNSDIWCEMIKTLAETISKEKFKDLEGLGIQFDKQELNKVQAVVSECEGVIHIAAINSLMMTILKVYQSLGSCMLIDISTLQDRAAATEIMLLWRWCPVLVVVMDNEDGRDALPRNVPGRTLVTISKDMSNVTYYDYKDNFCLEQLDGCSRAQVLSLPIKFQGTESTLWELLGVDSKLNIAINGDLIIEMLKGNKLSLGNELPELPEFYVPRALIRKCAVKQNILIAQVNAAVAISGMGKHEITKIQAEQRANCDEENIVTSAEITVLTVQDEEHFNRIKSQHKNIHFLQYENEVLYWRKSEGDVSFIRDFLEEEDSFIYKNVSTVDDVEDSVVILSAEPGMGKSTLLIKIARNTRSSKDSILVLLVNLIDCISELQKLPLELSIDSVYSFLINVSHTLELGGVFSARLFNMENVCLFFDGYDEISPDYTSIVSQMLRLLKATNPRKLFVTTRPGMRQALEQSLSTLAYTLQPFSKEDQESLLKNSWGCLNGSCPPEILQWFVDEVTSLLSKTINEKNLLGIPLQTMILAEIFADKFIILANSGKVTMPESLDPLYIFEEFIDRKFYIYWQKNGIDLSLPYLKENYKTLKKDFLENHMLCAVIVINPFMELKGESVTKLEELLNCIKEGRERTGIIIDIVNGIPVFVHRIFAEYFAALWFAENYKQYKSNIKTIHWDPTHSVVLDFFSRILAKNCKLHIAVLNMDTNTVKSKVKENPELVNAVDEGGRLPLHLAILNCRNCSEDSQSSVIAKILLSIDTIDMKRDKVLVMNPLEIAEKLEISWIVDILKARAEKAIINVPEQMVNVLQPVRSVAPSELRNLIDLLGWISDNIKKE